MNGAQAWLSTRTSYCRSTAGALATHEIPRETTILEDALPRMTFRCLPFRFSFCALDAVSFAPGTGGNTFRGALGHILRRTASSPEAYTRLFEPEGFRVPSGFAEAPRPLVIRASALEGHTYCPGEAFSIDIHLFDLRQPVTRELIGALERLAVEGIGPMRSRVRLGEVWTLDAARRPCTAIYRGGVLADVESPQPVAVPLAGGKTCWNGRLAGETACSTTRAQDLLTLRFATPTELKGGGAIQREAPFALVAARARDRIAQLSALYGQGPLALDFRGLAERAARVATVGSTLAWKRFERTSSRTHQTHPIGGFVGEACYRGCVGEFIPLLEAAYWTGIGRHTVWGMGVMEIVR